MYPGGGLIGAGDHCGAAGRADRAGDVAPGEANASGCEGVDVGSLVRVYFVPVAPDPGRHVLDEYPEDVGSGGSGSKGEKPDEQTEKKEGSDHV